MSSRLLMDEPPLVVSPSLATRLGLNEAIILQQIHFWVTVQEKKSPGTIGWVYNTYEQWSEHLPFFSARTVQRAILNLERMGYLRSRQSDGTNRVKLYRVDYQRFNADDGTCQIGTMERAKSGTLQDANLAPCIDTETTTETTDREKEESLVQDKPAPPPEETLFQTQEETPPPPSRGPADVIREHLFPYYLAEAGRGDYGLTPLRLKKGVERLRECLKRTGDPSKAVELFEQAIDGLTGDPWNCGVNPQKKKYLDWIDHLCVSPEMFDKRLEAGVAA